MADKREAVARAVRKENNRRRRIFAPEKFARERRHVGGIYRQLYARGCWRRREIMTRRGRRHLPSSKLRRRRVVNGLAVSLLAH